MAGQCTVPNFAVHDPTSECGHLHCAIHNVDELSYPSYFTCGECGHVYPTARALRRAERRWQWHARKFDDGWRFGWIDLALRLATVRVSRIASCALCSHDW